MDLSIGEAPSGGYACWDPRQCGFCKRLLDPKSVLDLFASEYLVVGKTLDLLQWSQAGRKCALCVYLCKQFLVELDGEPLVLDADVSLHWHLERKDNAAPQIQSFTVQFAWGLPHRRAKSVLLNCFAAESKNGADRHHTPSEGLLTFHNKQTSRFLASWALA
jgi:hypothetical protein